MEINEKVLKEVDEAAKMSHKSLNDFVENTFKENKTVEAYRKFPQKPEEYEIWQNEQVWDN